MRKIYLFLGQSGAGKDTLVEMLLKLFGSVGIRHLYVSIGDEVRGAIRVMGDENLFAKKTKAINDQGKLQPPVIALHFFLFKFIPNYTGEEIIIVNGSPRSEAELILWASLTKAGYLPEIVIVNLEATDEECRKRLKARPNRPDTEDDEARETKLAWYVPIRKMLASPMPEGVTLFTVDAMCSPDEVFQTVKAYFQEEEVLAKVFVQG